MLEIEDFWKLKLKEKGGSDELEISKGVLLKIFRQLNCFWGYYEIERGFEIET